MLDRQNLISNMKNNSYLVVTRSRCNKFLDFLFRNKDAEKFEHLQQFRVKYIHNGEIKLCMYDNALMQYVLNSNPVEVHLAIKHNSTIRLLWFDRYVDVKPDLLLTGDCSDKYNQFIEDAEQILNAIDDFLTRGEANEKLVINCTDSIHLNLSVYLESVAAVLLYQIDKYKNYVELCTSYANTSLRSTVTKFIGDKIHPSFNTKFKTSFFNRYSESNMQYLKNHALYLLIEYADGEDLSDEDVLFSIYYYRQPLDFKKVKKKSFDLSNEGLPSNVDFNYIVDYVNRTKHLIFSD